MKKLAIFLGIIGILAAAGGTALMILEPADTSDTNTTTNDGTTSSNALTCTAIVSDQGLATNTIGTFNFDSNNGLINFTMVLDAVAETEEAKASLAFIAGIYDLVKAEDEGIKMEGAMAADGASYRFTSQVDFETFDIEKYNSEHEGETTLEYKKGDTKETIEQSFIEQGGSCQ